jgi:hypothetical protein
MMILYVVRHMIESPYPTWTAPSQELTIQLICSISPAPESRL